MEHHAPVPAIAQGKTGSAFLAELESQPDMRQAAEAFRAALAVAVEAERRGGLALLVGGAVRDELFRLPVKDFDLEVYHLPPDEVKDIAARFGRVEEDVGRAFPVLKLWIGGGQLDIGSPRREQKTGSGHRGFAAETDPTMSAAEAVRRRDFTINALAKNPTSGEIIDYVGGLEDVERRILRVVDQQRFVEDPLRVLRGVQFAGRFGLSVEPRTLELLRATAPRLTELSGDRRRTEWDKLLLKSPRPSIGFALAREIGIFTNYPEITSMKETKQDQEFHPEGDVWTHTMLVLDEVQALASTYRLTDDRRAAVMLAAFGHDLGKTTTTEIVDNHIRSYGHETAGLAPMEKFLAEQGFTADRISVVLPLIREHMNPTALYTADRQQGIKDGAIRRLANRLHPATIKELVLLCAADQAGRGGPPVEFAAGPWLLERAARLNIQEQKPEPIIRGRDLQALGYAPGTIFGRIIRAAEKLAEEKNMSGQAILSRLKKHRSADAGLADLEKQLG